MSFKVVARNILILFYVFWGFFGLLTLTSLHLHQERLVLHVDLARYGPEFKSD